jgi:hypothetical protein
MGDPGDAFMGKQVLVAVDGDSPFEGSIIYGIRLAARIESGLAVIAVSPRKEKKRSGISQVSLKHPDGTQYGWLGRAMEESRKHSLGIEIFVTVGRLFEETARFVQSRPAVRFIVTAAPTAKEESVASEFAASLRRLRSAFDGEILVVEKAGEITRVSDKFSHSSAKGTSV